MEVVQFLPGWGVGAKLAKGHWQPGTFYQLTRLQLGKVGRSLFLLQYRFALTRAFTGTADALLPSV